MTGTEGKCFAFRTMPKQKAVTNNPPCRVTGKGLRLGPMWQVSDVTCVGLLSPVLHSYVLWTPLDYPSSVGRSVRRQGVEVLHGEPSGGSIGRDQVEP